LKRLASRSSHSRKACRHSRELSNPKLENPAIRPYTDNFIKDSGYLPNGKS
jgi:hypothetical protein